MKMTVTEGYLVTLADILTNPPAIFDGDCKGSVAMHIYLDRDVANKHRDAFRQAFPDVPEYAEYAKAHDSVYADAKVTTVDQFNLLPEAQRAAITAKIADIDSKYKDVLEKQQAVIRNRREALAAEVTEELYPISADDIRIKTGKISIPGSALNPWEVWSLLYADGKGIIRRTEHEDAGEPKGA